MRISSLMLVMMMLGSSLVPVSAQENENGDMPPMPRPRPEHAPTQRAPLSAADAIAAVTSAPQQVTLTATLTSEGEQVPEGLVWRIFDTTPDAAGELALLAKSEDAVANIELPPGDYVVHVAYGRAQASDTIQVTPGANAKSMAIEAGALRLNAAIDGDIPIPANLLRFDILADSDTGGDIVIAEDLLPNDMVTLNAGTYRIESHFGPINAVVRAELRVEPGQMTEATLYHHAAQISFRLVSEAGGEAIADVEWTVQDADGETLFTELGAFPSTVLAAGEYTVLAKQGESVFNRAFEVQPGPGREIELLTEVYQ